MKNKILSYIPLKKKKKNKIINNVSVLIKWQVVYRFLVIIRVFKSPISSSKAINQFERFFLLFFYCKYLLFTKN